ncbi:MAG: sigma-70 family RNA polymerase sigma factor [Gemmatimonadota bacterium]
MPRLKAPRASLPVRFARTSAFDQYLLDIQKLPMIADPEEERRLAVRARQGDRAAAERLVTANLRFVISYVKRFQGHGLDLADLVAIGNEGLLRAVQKFDPAHGVKFISYAVWWVRQAVLKALAEQSRSVRIPLNQNTHLIRLARTEAFLSQALGRQATDQEIALALDEPMDVIQASRRITVNEMSLDAPVERHERDAGTIGERFPASEGHEIEDHVDARLQREFIERLFSRYLSAREQRILTMYYGLDENEPLTLEEIGQRLGITRERVRQIRERAFQKLRASPDIRAVEMMV